MRTARLATILTLVNLAILMASLSNLWPAAAKSLPVLRGSALELMDDHGRVRAEIKVLPADPTVKMPDGSVGYPEAVQLRLFDSQGGPNVKLAATEDGSGLVLGGQGAYVQILSRGRHPFIKLAGRDQQERVIDLPAPASPGE
jgi:hypothetical protein